ncbi:MAG: hypothetical protein M0Z68_05520 [Gammaproteobacteria bacterium]|nr:hypothetical protein [Gammaproteobacteria bacterium]
MKCARCGSRSQPFPFEHAALLLCEGASDAAFFRQFLPARNLPESHIKASSDLGNGAGIDGFAAAIKGAKVASGFKKIKHLVIIADNDHDQTANFKRVKRQVESAGDIPIPEAPNIVQKESDKPDVTILMMPPGENTGSLESLIYSVARSANDANGRAVEDLKSASGVGAWSRQKQAKMLLRCFIACTYEKKPDIGLGQFFSQHDGGNLVSLDNSAFDPLSDLLSPILT